MIRSWALNHAALRAGRGNVDDVLALADWVEAVEAQRRAVLLAGTALIAMTDSIIYNIADDGVPGPYESKLREFRAALAALPPSAPRLHRWYHAADGSETEARPDEWATIDAAREATDALAALPPSAPPALDVDPEQLRKAIQIVADANNYTLEFASECWRLAQDAAAEYARLQEQDR